MKVGVVSILLKIELPRLQVEMLPQGPVQTGMRGQLRCRRSSLFSAEPSLGLHRKLRERFIEIQGASCLGQIEIERVWLAQFDRVKLGSSTTPSP